MAHASSIGLADWCVNLNGDINTACNGAGSGGMSTNPDGGSIILTSFSQLAEPTVNTLGSVVINLGAGTNQSVAFYADYDVDYPTLGAFLDSGTVHGPVPASYSYELSDPNTSNIFADFSGSTLPNTNSVGTPSGPPSPCCDVAFALAVAGINVVSGGSGTVTFTVGTVAPTSGFFIQQTNSVTSDSIFLSANVSTVGQVGNVPEPSTFWLFFGSLGIGIAILLIRQKRAGVRGPSGL